jgi:hypothetical protein
VTMILTPRRRVRAYRPAFTEAELERHQGFFWSMPSAWGKPETPVLREARRVGGVGALSLLPVLGRYVHWDKADHIALSLEECARLTGCDVGSIQRAARAFKALGLASTKLDRRHGQRLTVWNVTKGMASELRNGKLATDSFRFESRLVYSGTWSMLAGAQRAVYLALGTHAFTYSRDDALALLRATVNGEAALADAEELVHGAPGVAEPHERVRIAEVSVGQLGRILGMSHSAVHDAINGFKDHRHWSSSGAAEDEVRHAPIRVFPTLPGRSNVFVFRDSAPRWPLDMVNARLTPG